MKIKEGFVLQNIANDHIVVPIAQESERINGIIKLNETGCYLWSLLSQKDQTIIQLVDILSKEFCISIELAQKDVEEFVNTLRNLGCFSE